MIYLDLFIGFLKVGLFSFGGAYGAIPIIKDVVMHYKWMNEDQLANQRKHPRAHHGQSGNLCRKH